MNPYETERLLSEYLLFHYGALEEVLPWSFGPQQAWNFPARVAEAALKASSAISTVSTISGGGRALDLGCAVGRTTFELARGYEEVMGIDFSHRFIQAARTLQEEGELAYRRVDEGELTTPLLARVPEGVDRSRLRFEQGDAQELPESLGQFDLVVAANLLCRLPDPRRCLARFPTLVNPGGRLLITTPCTWMEDYTPRHHWLGGIEGDSAHRHTLDALRAALEPHFTLTERGDLPFLIREHARKYQWSVAEVSLWQRRTDLQP